jgi:hypothetical protein
MALVGGIPKKTALDEVLGTYEHPITGIVWECQPATNRLRYKESGTLYIARIPSVSKGGRNNDWERFKTDEDMYLEITTMVQGGYKLIESIASMRQKRHDETLAAREAEARRFRKGRFAQFVRNL